MTIWVPGWMQGGTYTAQVDRINSRAQDWDEGVTDRLALKVTQRALGANMTVDVAAGDCIVSGDDQANQGNYDVRSDALTSVTGFTAPGAGTSRYDAVGVQINDPNAGGAAGSNATIVRIAGTAAASPVIPDLSVGAGVKSFLLLAIVGPFLPATTTITNAMIFDAHTGGGPTGSAGARLLAGFRDAPGTSKNTYSAVPPNGWLTENGQAVSRTTYARLFEHLGTTFGVGDGSTTFNIPNSNGRVQASNGWGTGLLSGAVGTQVGETDHVLTPTELTQHTHAVIDPTHQHLLGVGAAPPPGTAHSAILHGTVGQTDFSPTGFTSSDATGITVDLQGGNGAHNNIQPTIICYRIIRT